MVSCVVYLMINIKAAVIGFLLCMILNLMTNFLRLPVALSIKICNALLDSLLVLLGIIVLLDEYEVLSSGGSDKLGNVFIITFTILQYVVLGTTIFSTIFSLVFFCKR